MSNTDLDCVTREITLRGVADMMFDRYAGDNKTELRPEEKMYFGRDGRTLVLPAANIMSLLTSQNTPSAPKRFLDPRKYKKVAQGILSYTVIQPHLIPLTREGKPVVFMGFDKDEDPESGVYIQRSVARLDKGFPNPKVRPVLPVPWELAFQLLFYKNDEVQEETLRNLVIRGGISIGLGTYRGVFGKFMVDKWD